MFNNNNKSQFQHTSHLLQTHSSPLQLLLLFLLFPFDLLVKMNNGLRMMACMDFGELGTQLIVQSSKFCQRDGPHTLIQSPDSIPIHKW